MRRLRGAVRALSGALVFASLGALPAAARAVQDHAPAAGQDEAQESDLDRYLRLAREGSAVVRPQAAERLVELGDAAAERLVALCGEGNAGLAELGPEVTGVLARFGDVRLRARLWSALSDPDFPWRPAAALSLAEEPRPDEPPRFVALLEDPIATVREPAVLALATVDERAAEPQVRARLADPDDRVRRAAVRALFAWGDHCTVAWLLEDLRREDRYFDLQTGKLARYQALRVLEGGLTKVRRHFGYKAEKPWDDPANAEAVARIGEYVAQLCEELPEVPPVARAAGATEGDCIGLEVRSCRRGEHYLRWSEGDVLYVGLGNAVRVELPAGTVARLRELTARTVEALGEQRLWGQPGCDLEQLHWRPDPGGRTTTFRVSKGQASIDGLRPGALGALEEALLATLPEDGDDPRTRDLRARVRAALRSVGGELGQG